MGPRGACGFAPGCLTSLLLCKSGRRRPVVLGQDSQGRGGCRLRGHQTERVSFVNVGGSIPESIPRPTTSVSYSYTNWAIGAAVSSLVECILKNEKRVVPVSTCVRGLHGVEKEVFLSVPCVLDRSGISRVGWTNQRGPAGVFCTGVAQYSFYGTLHTDPQARPDGGGAHPLPSLGQQAGVGAGDAEVRVKWGTYVRYR